MQDLATGLATVAPSEVLGRAADTVHVEPGTFHQVALNEKMAPFTKRS